MRGILKRASIVMGVGVLFAGAATTALAADRPAEIARQSRQQFIKLLNRSAVTPTSSSLVSRPFSASSAGSTVTPTSASLLQPRVLTGGIGPFDDPPPGTGPRF